MSQLHKRFTTEQVKELLERYINKKIERKHIEDLLIIKKRQFFKLLKEYKNDPEIFSIDYSRKSPKRISDETDKIIVKELKIDQKIIKDKNNPTQWYNYSYVRDRLEDKYKQKVSLPTIIDRAKKYDLYLQKKSKKKLMTVKS